MDQESKTNLGQTSVDALNHVNDETCSTYVNGKNDGEIQQGPISVDEVF